MAFTLNRRLAQLVDSNGQLNTGKIPNDYITSDHVADNTITSAMLHTSFTISTSNLTAIDTDDVSEGSTNLYYTDARVGTYISGNRDYGNITTTGYIAGPATFTIDPAAVGDNTGTVVIAGNLQVDGTTTTINSTTMEVDDLNITLASGAANAAAANGAGITVDGASATLTYSSTGDSWEFNKNVGIGVTPSAWDGSMTALQLDTGSIYVNSARSTYIAANFYYDTTSNTNKYIENGYAAALGLSNGRHEFYVAGSGTAGNDVSFTEAMRIHSDGKVGIGSDVVSGPVMGLHVGNGSGVLFGPSGNSGSTYISPDHENTINGNYGIDTDNADLWVNYRGYQNGTSRFRNFKIGQGKEDLIAVFEGSSGNVGIGTANGGAIGAKLHVAGTIKGTDLIAHDSTGLAFQTDEGTKRISILDSGNVVIGDNSLIGSKPTSSALNIFGDGVTLRLDGSGNSTKTILFRGTSAGNPGEVYADGGLRLRTEDSGMPITFHTNSTGSNNERMRIDGTDGSVRFKVGAGDSGTNTVNTGSVSISNTDLDSNTQYTIRGGRYLTSNGTGWETGADGKNPALVIHNDTSQTDNRNWPGIIMHNENNTASAYGPFIGWGAKSASTAYNTTYAWITGRPTGTGNDSNWRAGELELYTQHPGGYVGQKPGIRITSDGLVQQPKLYDSNGFFWVRGTSNPSTSGESSVIFTTLAQAGSGNYSTTTGRYTAPVEGVYHFSTNVRIDSASNASSYFRIAFYTGTSPSAAQSGFGQGHSIYGPGSYSTDYFSMQTSWSVYLSAQTQVGVVVSLDNGTYTIHQESQFSGHLVG